MEDLIHNTEDWLYFKFKSGNEYVGIGNLFDTRPNSPFAYHKKGSGNQLIVDVHGLKFSSFNLFHIRKAVPSDFDSFLSVQSNHKYINLTLKQIEKMGYGR